MSEERRSLSRRTFVAAAGASSALAFTGFGLTGCGESGQDGSKKESGGEGGSAGQAIGKPTEKFGTGKYGGKPVEAYYDAATGEIEVNPDVLVRYSACLGCYASCGNKVRIDRKSGDAIATGGNPYNPNCAFPYLEFDAPLTDALKAASNANGFGMEHRGTSCARGQATLEAYQDRKRITKPLKRAGKRGEGKWKEISWEQLIEEVVEGGKLFADIGEDREIEGFRAIHDTETPIDPAAPELGPKSNQLVQLGGRGDGRAFLAGRIAGAFGTVNNNGHGGT